METLTKDHIKIIKVAFKRFSQFGHEKTTMAEIAKDCGYTRTFLYYYFPDKDSIFKGALSLSYQDFIKKLDEIRISDTTNKNKLIEALRARIDYAKPFFSLGIYKKPVLFKMVIEDKELKKVRPIHIKVMSDFIKDGIKAKEFKQNLDVVQTATSLNTAIASCLFYASNPSMHYKKMLSKEIKKLTSELEDIVLILVDGICIRNN